MHPPSPDTGVYGIEHHSSPYGDGGITTVSAPPPPQSVPYEASIPVEPPVARWKFWQKQTPVNSPRRATGKQQPGANIDIEAAISRTVAEQIDESKSFGTSLLHGIKKYLVPMGTVMDIISAFLRFLTLGFLIVLPDLYRAIFYPPQGDNRATAAHYIILAISVMGMAIGVPVALFSSVYSLVTLLQKADAAQRIKRKSTRRERLRHLNRKIRIAWIYIFVSFACSASLSVPYILENNKAIPAQQKLLIAEACFIVIPIVAAIITMITERESGADEQEKSSQLGVNIGLFGIFTAGSRIAHGLGTFKDAAAIRAAMDGDMAVSIEAGVKEQPDIKYLTLAEVAVRLGRSPDKADSFRRTLNNIVSAAYRKGELGIIQHPKRGYMVPETAFVTLFDKYLDGAPRTAQEGGKLLELKSKDKGEKDTKKESSGRKKVEAGFWKRVRFVFDKQALGA